MVEWCAHSFLCPTQLQCQVVSCQELELRQLVSVKTIPIKFYRIGLATEVLCPVGLMSGSLMLQPGSQKDSHRGISGA